MTIDPAAWPPQGSVFSIKGVDAMVEEEPHSFYLAEKDRIRENWQRELAANPALYDGDVLMQEEISLVDGTLRAIGRPISFSTLLWWRRQAEPASGYVIVGTAVPISSDGAIIAIRMAQHTANAGKVYCAAGSLDRDDVMDGRCDVLGNMARELKEETGLDLSESRMDGPLRAVWTGRRIYVFALYQFAETADVLCDKVRMHMASEADSEIDDVLALRTADPRAHDYDQMTRLLLPFFFAES